MLRVIATTELDGLAECLQRVADREGRPMLLIAQSCPKREYTSGPYGVFEDQADQWEKENSSRRITPRGEAGGAQSQSTT